MTLSDIFTQLTDIETQLSEVERTKTRIAAIRARFDAAGMKQPPALDDCTAALATIGADLSQIAVAKGP